MRRLFLALLLVPILLGSCQPAKLLVSVYTPPKLVFPPEIRAFLVTSRYVPATGPYEDLQWGAYESVDSLKWKMAESLIDTLGKRMNEGNLFLARVKHYPRMLRHNDASLPDPLPWEGLISMASKEFVQGFIIMEGFDITETPVGYTQHSSGWTAAYSVNVTMAVRASEPEKMRLLDDSVYTFSSRFEGTGTTRELAASALPDSVKARFKACSDAAEAYANLIRPGTVETRRSLYLKGDTTLVKASKALAESKWGRAESNWKWLAYNSKDSVIQAKASLNMALACERDGRLNQAVGYARRSQRIHPNRKTEEYIEILDRKIRDLQALVDQGKIVKRW